MSDIFLSLENKKVMKVLTHRYLTSLKNLAESCQYGELKDGLIRDAIIVGIKNAKLREVLLREDDLTLEKTCRICVSNEALQAQVKVFNMDNTFDNTLT